MFKRYFPILALLLAALFAAAPASAAEASPSDGPPNMEVPRTTPAQLAAELGKVVIIDDRSTYGWNIADTKIKGAIRVENYSEFAKTHPKDTPIVIYCSCPDEHTSARVAQQLKDMGFTNASALQGGWDEWVDEGLPVEPKE